MKTSMLVYLVAGLMENRQEVSGKKTANRGTRVQRQGAHIGGGSTVQRSGARVQKQGADSDKGQQLSELFDFLILVTLMIWSGKDDDA
jgi:fermentation-respiration switch protein FrsA (DUF1100 family)